MWILYLNLTCYHSKPNMKCFCLASFDRKLLSLDPQARVWGIGKYRHRSTINDAVRADQANSLQQSAGRAVSHLTSPHPTPLCSSDGPPHSFVCIVSFLGWLARCSMRSCYLLSNSAYISTLHCGGVWSGGGGSQVVQYLLVCLVRPVLQRHEYFTHILTINI